MGERGVFAEHYESSEPPTVNTEAQLEKLVSSLDGSDKLCSYVSTPPPPEELWDTADMQFLEKVKCVAAIRLTAVDPKNGCFEARMKCKWSFRTLNSQDRTEVQLRVPGIRMPGLVVTVEESRIWRDLELSNERTVFWSGTSLFSLSGYEIFEMQDFPFDRQVINFELMDFVWRPHKDAATYDFSMKIVELTVHTTSMLHEWATYSAIVLPENERRLRRGPSSASRFRLSMRIERKHWYYVIQIFLVTYLITTVSCFPLAMPPTEAHVGDRLSLYGGGLLTLVAFKYSIADHLPSVPYSTFMDYYLLWQIVTLIGLSVETLISYRIVKEAAPSTSEEILEELLSNTVTGANGTSSRHMRKFDEAIVDNVENGLLVLLVVVWLCYFVYASFFKKRKPWKYIFTHQDKNEQRTSCE